MQTAYTVSTYLIKKLHECGVKHIFGVPGDYVLGLYDQLIRTKTLEVINTCDEHAIPSNIKNVVNGTVIGNPDPVRDDCSPSFLPSSGAISMVGKNIGNLLNSKNITWGWFSAGFKPSIMTAEGKWICTFTNHTR